MAKTKTAKAKPEHRHDVQYEFRGQTRFGVVAYEKSKKPGHIIVDDSVLPFRAEVLDDDKVIDIESSWTKGERPVYDRNTGLLTSGGNAKDKWLNAEAVKAQALSKAAGKGVVVNKLFSIGVADGSATYIVTKVTGTKCDVEWRGFDNGDRYTDHFFGYGKKGVSKKDVQAYIGREEGMADFWSKLQDEDAAFLDGLKVGAVVHYSNGFNDFVRYEVVDDNGTKKYKPIALVGDWKSDKPHRYANGEVTTPYHVEKVLKGELVERLQAATVYESPKCEKTKGKGANTWTMLDPTKLDPLPLVLPDMTPEQLEVARLYKLAHELSAVLSGQAEKDRGTTVAYERDYKAETHKERMRAVLAKLRAELSE